MLLAISSRLLQVPLAACSSSQVLQHFQVGASTSRRVAVQAVAPGQPPHHQWQESSSTSQTTTQTLLPSAVLRQHQHHTGLIQTLSSLASTASSVLAPPLHHKHFPYKATVSSPATSHLPTSPPLAPSLRTLFHSPLHCQSQAVVPDRPPSPHRSFSTVTGRMGCRVWRPRQSLVAAASLVQVLM